MNIQIFKLHFLTPLHIGDNRPNYESCEGFIRSDTLFSALINAWQLLYPEDCDLLFPQDAPATMTFPYFSISSAFPYLGDELFFPKPHLKLPLTNDPSTPNLAKKIKKLTWLTQSRFEDCLSRRPFTLQESNIIGEKFLSAHSWNEQPPIMTIGDAPRIVKDRSNEQTEIYYYSRLYFAADAGLFFLARIQEQWQTKFRTVLNLLGDEGIGGDRSVGHGRFQVQSTGPLTISLPPSAKHFITLALYHPQPSELPTIISTASYELLLRSGWIYSGQGKSLRRAAVRMFTEGSVFTGTAQTYGDLVKVQDPLPTKNLHHAVYRYGQALTLPIAFLTAEELC